MGHSEAEARRMLGAGPFRSFTRKTLTTPEAFLGAIREAQKWGFALDNEEREEGVRCIAAPVRDNRGKVVASMSLSAPASRVPDERVQSLGERIKRAADAVSARLGWKAQGLG